MRSGGDTKEEAEEEVVEGCRTRKKIPGVSVFLTVVLYSLLFSN